MKTKGRKLLLTLLTIGLVGTIAGFGAYSAFSDTTDNSGNDFTAGSVVIDDNDAGTALYNVSNQKPGQTTTKCIKVSYTGSLAADVKIYASAVAAGGQYVNLTVTSGTGNNTNCSDFAADASGSNVYTGTVKGFADTHSSYANGLADNPLAQSSWTNGNAVTYKFDVSVQDNNAAQSATTGTHTYTWEARNQ